MFKIEPLSRGGNRRTDDVIRSVGMTVILLMSRKKLVLISDDKK